MRAFHGESPLVALAALHIKLLTYSLTYLHTYYTELQYADCCNCVLQALREKCLQLEDDVHMLSDKLKQAQDIVAEKDRYIDVCDVDF